VIAVKELPDWVLAAKASLAMTLCWGPMAGRGGPLHPDYALELLAAGGAFCAAAPWRYFANEFPLTLQIDGEPFEASVMGAGGQEFGVALYPGKGGLKRLLDTDDPRAVDSLAVTFDEEPHWAAEAAIALVPPIAGVPIPIQLERRMPGVPAPRGLLQLAAALEAVSQISPDQREASAAVEVDGARVEVRAQL
jgi:hypothetical protein